MINRTRVRSLTVVSAVIALALVLPSMPAAATDAASPTPGPSQRVQVEGDTAEALARADALAGGATTLRPFAAESTDDAGIGAAVISGTVVDGAGAGMAGVEVSAFAVTTTDDGTLREIAATVATDESGAYRFEALAAGSYDLFFLPLERKDLAWGWFAGGVSPGADPLVTVADGEAQTLDPRVLVPAMEIAGAVVSTRNGGILDGTRVVLWGSSGPDAEGISSFEPLLVIAIDGAPFSFGQLPPGQYLLDATRARGSYLGEWWNNAQSFETADVIEASGWFELALPPIVRLGTVAISGASATGSTVMATHNTFSGTTYKYVWYADGKAISGATGKSYRIPSSLQHKRLTVKVTGSKTGGVTASATSEPRAKILLTGTPTISGKTAIKTSNLGAEWWSGYTLTANPGTWTTGATLRYQWYADGKARAGATSKTYKLQNADRGKRITVKVNGSKSGYGSFTRTSAATNRIALLGDAVMMSNPRVGERLWWSMTGTWSSDAKITLRLYADGVLVSTVDQSQDVVKAIPASWLGKRLRTTVTVIKPGYTTHVVSSETSNPVRW